MAAGNQKKHSSSPLFLNEILNFLRLKKKDLNYIFDGTLGDGGHSTELKKTFNNIKIVALDQDPEAIQKVKEKNLNSIEKKDMELIQTDFLNFSKLIKTQWLKKNENSTNPKYLSPTENKKRDESLNFLEKFDALLFDLGPSLSQLTQGHRGFSFYSDGPLDMRMNQTKNTFTASDILNTWDKKDLMNLFFSLGEIKNPSRVVHAILKERKKKPFQNTLEFSKLIEKIIGWKKKSYHPATPFFQSLRIQVNDELSQIKKAFPYFLHLLKPEGLFFVISFHSLEDRIIKNLFKDFKKQKKGNILTPKVIQASYKEKKAQPRMRSAKLRVFQKLSLIE